MIDACGEEDTTAVERITFLRLVDADRRIAAESLYPSQNERRAVSAGGVKLHAGDLSCANHCEAGWCGSIDQSSGASRARSSPGCCAARAMAARRVCHTKRCVSRCAALDTGGGTGGCGDVTCRYSRFAASRPGEAPILRRGRGGGPEGPGAALGTLGTEVGGGEEAGGIGEMPYKNTVGEGGRRERKNGREREGGESNFTVETVLQTLCVACGPYVAPHEPRPPWCWYKAQTVIYCNFKGCSNGKCCKYIHRR